MNHKIIGTAGHIDHGKTSLVAALTGIDTDRLKEEKEREITIDLGFAFLGQNISFIDVPGHEKFVKNMVAGITGIDIALLVIAADDGIMPQTLEHLDILKLLNIKRLIVAITKTDIVEDEWTDLVTEEIKKLINKKGYTDPPVLHVSPVTGTGIEDLKKLIINEAEKQTPEEEEITKLPFRMPVDRSFSMTGFGTVATGTVISGKLNINEKIELLPAGQPLKLRSIQRNNESKKTIEPGDRAALNLSNIQKNKINRGDVIAHSGVFIPSVRLNCLLHYLKSADKPLKYRERIRFHCGTAEVIGRIVILDRDIIEPGGLSPVQIQLEKPVVAAVDDRFIIRSYSPILTIGGGKILEINADAPKRNRPEIAGHINNMADMSTSERLVYHVRKKKFEPVGSGYLVSQFGRSIDMIEADLEKEKALKKLVIENNNLWIDKALLTKLKDNILNHVSDFHKEFPEKPNMPVKELISRLKLKISGEIFKHVLEKLEKDKEIIISNENIKRGNFKPAVSDKMKETKNVILKHLKQNNIEGPTKDELIKDLEISEEEAVKILDILLDEDIITIINNSFFYLKAELDKIEETIKDIIRKNESLGIGEFRTVLQTSRKYALPLLNYFDDRGLTVRIGDERVLKKLQDL
ncbi:selenocysteine-specific translation elongation factor [candidate division KSB1 bacterium]